jgi:hypothetical protein
MRTQRISLRIEAPSRWPRCTESASKNHWRVGLRIYIEENMKRELT